MTAPARPPAARRRPSTPGCRRRRGRRRAPPARVAARGGARSLCVVAVIAVVALAAPPQPAALQHRPPPAATTAATTRCRPSCDRLPVARPADRLGPGWYDGFPLYTFYFVLPDLLAALASYVIPYGIAFKWMTVLGSVLLPVAAWAMGRLFGMRPRLPRRAGRRRRCASCSTTRTPSTGGTSSPPWPASTPTRSASRWPWSSSGSWPAGCATGRHRGWAAVVLAACILCPHRPGALRPGRGGGPGRPRAAARPGAAAGRLARPPDGRGRRRRPEPARSAVVGGLDGRPRRAPGRVLVGALRRSTSAYATSMGYAERHHVRGPFCLPRADWWALILAGARRGQALALRSRFGILMAVLGGPVGPGRDLRPPGQPLQRPVPAAVVPLRLPPGRVGFAVGGRCRGHRLVATSATEPPFGLAAVAARAGDPGRRPPPPASRSGPWPPAAVVGPLVALVGGLLGVVRDAVRAAGHGAASDHARGQPGHQLGGVQLQRVRGQAGLSRVPGAWSRRWHGSAPATGAGRRCGSTTPASTASGPPRP